MISRNYEKDWLLFYNKSILFSHNIGEPFRRLYQITISLKGV